MRLFLYGNASCVCMNEKREKRQVPCKVILYLLFNNSNLIFSFLLLRSDCMCSVAFLTYCRHSSESICARCVHFRFSFLNVYDEIKTVEKSSDHKSIPQRNITATLHNIITTHSSTTPCHYPLASFSMS